MRAHADAAVLMLADCWWWWCWDDDVLMCYIGTLNLHQLFLPRLRNSNWQHRSFDFDRQAQPTKRGRFFLWSSRICGKEKRLVFHFFTPCGPNLVFHFHFLGKTDPLNYDFFEILNDFIRFRLRAIWMQPEVISCILYSKFLFYFIRKIPDFIFNAPGGPDFWFRNIQIFGFP